MADRLRALHISFVEVPHGTLNDVYTGITLIARAAGLPERAIALNSRMQSDLGAILTRAMQMTSPRVLVIVNRRPGMLVDLTAVGPNNYLQQLLEIAGGANVLARPGVHMYPRISLETVLRDDPDVILDLSGEQESESERLAASAQVQALWSRQSQLTTVRRGG